MTRSIHSYGSGPSQVAELFLPRGTGPFAVAIVVHGGYWKSQYDRSLMEGLCVDLAAPGLAAWNLEYRRVGGAGGWPETFLDVAEGIDHLAELHFEHIDARDPAWYAARDWLVAQASAARS